MMNTTTFGKTALFIAIAAVTACDSDFSNPVDDSGNYRAGDADFSRFVALGDSLTAGYRDGTVFRSAQIQSYPNILAQQFQQVGGGEFTQPLVDDDIGGLLMGGTQLPGFNTRLVLKGTSQADLSPTNVAGPPTTEVSNIQAGPYNNMGVSGAKSFHAAANGYGNIAGLSQGTANPYFVRSASSENASMIEDAAGQQPSFFVLWLGNNDTLAFATDGGTGKDQTGNTVPSTYGINDITDPGVFAQAYSGFVSALTAAGAKGVLVTLPDVSSIPFFNTVPYNAVPMDETQATQANGGFVPYNAGLDVALANGIPGLTQEEVDARKIQFAAGQNALVIEDEDLTDLTALSLPSYRQATAADLPILTSRTKIGTPVPSAPTTLWGISAGLADGDVLTANEIAAINAANIAYNQTIAQLAASSPDLALTDAKALLAEVKANGAAGLDYGTGKITATYASGGGFSLDGVHPTARGYAIIANAIMDTIEEAFGAKLKRVDPNDYPTVTVE